MSGVTTPERRLRELRELRARIDNEISKLERDTGGLLRTPRREVGRRRRAIEPNTGPRAADIRAWSIANGIPMGTHGRIRSEVREQYLAAQNGANA